MTVASFPGARSCIKHNLWLRYPSLPSSKAERHEAWSTAFQNPKNSKLEARCATVGRDPRTGEERCAKETLGKSAPCQLCPESQGGSQLGKILQFQTISNYLSSIGCLQRTAFYLVFWVVVTELWELQAKTKDYQQLPERDPVGEEGL